MDKLIRVKLGSDLQIPSKYQIADISNYLDPYIPDIFNWALHAPGEILPNFIRAVDLNYYISSGKAEDLKGVPGFIASCCYKPKDPESFVALSDLKEALFNYLEVSAECVNEDIKRRSESFMGNMFEVSFENIFGENML